MCIYVACVCIYVSMCMNVCIYIYMHMSVHAYACVHVHVHVNANQHSTGVCDVYVCMCVCSLVLSCVSLLWSLPPLTHGACLSSRVTPLVNAEGSHLKQVAVSRCQVSHVCLCAIIDKLDT